jgi:hypothetical protein
VIPIPLASSLRAAGLAWHPAQGDRFVIPNREMDNEIFVLSTMTIDVHDLPEGQLLGFNGTVEWALDSLAKEDALWLPREDQLRTLLAGTFRRLERSHTAAGYTVTVEVNAKPRAFTAADPETAYGTALLWLIAGDEPPAAGTTPQP